MSPGSHFKARYIALISPVWLVEREAPTQMLVAAESVTNGPHREVAVSSER